MYIGDVFIPNPLVLAPMAGVTDLAFRRVCRELGAGLTVFSLLDANRAAHPGAELGAIRTCAHRRAAIRARLMTAR